MPTKTAMNGKNKQTPGSVQRTAGRASTSTNGKLASVSASRAPGKRTTTATAGAGRGSSAPATRGKSTRGG
jgi:hypothetical protein